MVGNHVVVCNGCCCGVVEKGAMKVPIEQLRAAWETHELATDVKLMISGCLGPCRMKNVSLLRSDEGETWIGNLTENDHYDALVEWAIDVKQNGSEARLPARLAQLQFDNN